jgi:hypothetical protein
MTNQIDEGLKRGATFAHQQFTPDAKFIKSWGRSARHEFRTPTLMFDAKGRLWVAR